MSLSTRTQIEQKLKKEKRLDKIVGRQDVTEGLTESQVNALIAQYLIDNPVGGGGVFRVISVDRGQIPIGGSGTLLSKSIADVAGATVIKIKHLLTTSASSQGNITLETDGNVLFSGILSDNTPSSGASGTSFGITSFLGGTTPSSSAGILSEVFCESFNLSITTGTTATPIDYVIEYGVVE